MGCRYSGGGSPFTLTKMNLLHYKLLCPHCDDHFIFKICDKYACEFGMDEDGECTLYDEMYQEAEKRLCIEECDECINYQKFHEKEGL